MPAHRAGARAALADRAAQQSRAASSRRRNARRTRSTARAPSRSTPTDPDACERAVASVAERHGRIDGLVCSAALFAFKGALELTAADLEEMLHVNVTGSLLPSQAAARAMIADGHDGAIVLVSSSAGQRAVGAPAYGASKGAVEALGRELALA